MKDNIYSFVFKGLLAEEALDKAGRQKYHPEAVYFDEDIAKKLHFKEIDERYIQQSKSMVVVFTTLTAFENATREFIFSVLVEAYKEQWWINGVHDSIRRKAESLKLKEEKIRYSSNRGDDILSYIEFSDLSKIMCSSDNWQYFEPQLQNMDWVKNVFSQLGDSRNVIMHSGILDEYDISRVGTLIRDWLRQINA